MNLHQITMRWQQNVARDQIHRIIGGHVGTAGVKGRFIHNTAVHANKCFFFFFHFNHCITKTLQYDYTLFSSAIMASLSPEFLPCRCYSLLQDVLIVEILNIVLVDEEQILYFLCTSHVCLFYL